MYAPLITKPSLRAWIGARLQRFRIPTPHSLHARYAFTISPAQDNIRIDPTIMFGRAVQSHEKSRPPPSHSNPASSTNSTQSSLQNSFAGKPATAPEKSKVSASITSFVNPTASTRRPTNFGLASLSASSAFDSKPTPPTLSESTGNSVSQLHDAVYFDDVDFSDEEDLEFAISQPILPSLEKVAKKIASPPRKIASPPRRIPSPPRKIVVSPPTKPRAALPVTNPAAKPSAPTMQQHRDDRSNHFNKDAALEDWDSDVDLLPKSQRVVEKPDSRFSKPAKPQDRAPPSSAPVPWSSSPVEHMAPRMPSISESIATIDLTSSRSSLVSSAAKRRTAAAEEAQGLHPKKRRTIPWENDPNAQLVEPVVARASTTAATATTSTTSTTSTARTKSTTTTATTSSSIIKNRSDSLPWNDSFSNFEAGKKEARKQNALRMQKRSMHGEAANPEDVRSLRKTKESLPGIFLSEEQKRVVDLVATQGQSVFFTGSAGKLYSITLKLYLLTYHD
ncbi:hypothetical protein BZA77DRAFT_313585 [Pyronema omphalodes]|nr:hypothetical protein BZA77DRAFT_313585 [Pyronema omphalodes]